MFISTFLKIKNPSMDDNACMGICDLDNQEILDKLSLEKCDQMEGKTGHSNSNKIRNCFRRRVRK